MGVIVPEGDVTITSVWTNENSPKECTWSFGMTPIVAVPTSSSVEDLLDDIATIFTNVTNGPFQAPLYSNEWTFAALVGTLMTDTGPIPIVRAIGASGTRNEDPIPINCAFLLNKVTARGGRTGKGRAYIPPAWIDESLVNSGGQVVSPGFGTRSTYMDAALVSLTTEAWGPVLHHSDGSPGTAITGWNLSTTIATQRRRLR